MFKKIIITVTLCLICFGCIDANLDTDVKTDLKADIEKAVEANIEKVVDAEMIKVAESMENLVKAEVKTSLQANANINTDLEAKLSNKMDTKLNVLGGDIKQKVADELKAHFDTKIETHTQNQGMFSGGGIYVTAVAVFLILTVAGTVIYLFKTLMSWKRIWHVTSQCIEEQGENGGKEQIEKLKRMISSSLGKAQLKHHVDKNLEKRGLRHK
jgi:hypothetical protein